MKILEYTGLDTARVATQYHKVSALIAGGDFRAAQVKKLSGHGHERYYRARLDDANRLLFTLIRSGGELCALMLEVIWNHDYNRSRFLRGAAIDEAKIPDAVVEEALRDAQPLRYLHPERSQIHLLDKPISFDDAQQQVYLQRPPLIVVGSAGSGKTALTLEKLKHAEGEVLYVTHSAFLARSARELYYAHGFEHPGQDAMFLSFREFLETLRVPDGQEATWPRFSAWFRRMQSALPGVDAHQAFEEIRGVLTAQTDGMLSREAYLALGVRQSIFASDRRDALYDLFERYRAWLSSEQLFDLNLLAHERVALAAPRYDFVVIDEVQDLTAVQLFLVLKTLRKPGQFLLCGDSNQIVHPSFFSWSQVKSLFWRDAKLAARQELCVLSANFRNAGETTRIANTLLKIKHRRFGSIDRESNFLVQAVGAEPGQAALLPDKESVTRALDQQARQSAEVAVLVMRDEDKPAARKIFSTPLLFSVQEAKGLEYSNIILYRFVSDHRAEFAEIAVGTTLADLSDDTLEYRRARDKSDKSPEIYKFYVNALYVALTRAVKNVYVVESDTHHPLFALLQVGAQESARVEARTASRDDWQREAHKLELQGKQEQADAIRRDFLKQAVPPWPVFDEARMRETLAKVFRDQAPGNKQRQQVYDYAAVMDAPMLAEMLAGELKFGSVEGFERERRGVLNRSLAAYAAKNIKDVLRQCEQFGIEHRTPMNLTPLMAAAVVGNLPLIEALIERGADTEAVDDFGQNALHWALHEAFSRPEYARGVFAAVFERIAPTAVDLQSGERLVRVDRHLSEYFLFQSLWVLFRSRFTRHTRRMNSSFDTAALLEAWAHMPANVLRSERNRRAHISHVLSRNEIDRDYAYNRALFRRVEQGWYQFNPSLRVRVRSGADTTWLPIFQRLNLPLIGELTPSGHWLAVAGLTAAAKMGMAPVPIAAERWYLRRVELQKREDEERAALAARQAQAREHAARAAVKTGDPPWGTPAAKRLALQRLMAANATRRKSETTPE